MEFCEKKVELYYLSEHVVDCLYRHSSFICVESPA